MTASARVGGVGATMVVGIAVADVSVTGVPVADVFVAGASVEGVSAVGAGARVPAIVRVGGVDVVKGVAVRALGLGIARE